MDTVEIKGSNIPGLRQILDAGVKLGSRDLGSFLETNVDSYTNPKPIFRTTYLDDQIRISRDQDNKVFVYGKISDETDVSDYSGIMADLGVAKLLEGFNDAVIKYYI
uniref:Plastid lipid-associated protein/fibrillin conserved domain-containing protein n=2 Tax=Proboscia inermis TaxID=420281 RepID=A0A7S0C2H2_9STRA|mmetsp:Transcript_22682/g.23010  ORF Transcript_22682/g.23010 Transcript_22682/m.23010 type:complete len:107 (+) Transcript_22682:155-475(+)